MCPSNDTLHVETERIRATTSRAMRDVALLHLPSVRWRWVRLPGSTTCGLLGELITPDELAQLQALLRS